MNDSNCMSHSLNHLIQRVWRLNKVDMIPFLACFIFCLRKSSTGLIVGIIVHLVILLGKFMFPVDRTLSKGNRIILQGQLMYPSGDVCMMTS